MTDLQNLESVESPEKIIKWPLIFQVKHCNKIKPCLLISVFRLTIKPVLKMPRLGYLKTCFRVKCILRVDAKGKTRIVVM